MRFNRRNARLRLQRIRRELVEMGPDLARYHVGGLTTEALADIDMAIARLENPEINEC